MLQFIIKRLLQTLVVMWGITIIVFLILHMTPGDPVRVMLGDHITEDVVIATRAEMGFDQPLYIQYWRYLTGLLRGDWGRSIFFRQPSLNIILPAMVNTIYLTIATILVSLIIAIPLGILAGIKRGSVVDLFSMGFALLGQSMSPVWLGILLICYI